MDFFVYDNIYTYNKRNVYNGNPNSRLTVDRIELPENGSFWYFTAMNFEQNNVNIQKRYVHIHPGIGTTNQVHFEKNPFHVKKGDMIYNPKEKALEVKEHFWSKPLFKKTVTYYGSELPKKKMACIGEWIYDFGNNSIHFIIDYMPQKIKYSWEDENEEMAEFEQMMRVEELEEKIAIAEKAIKAREAKGRFDSIPSHTVDP